MGEVHMKRPAAANVSCAGSAVRRGAGTTRLPERPDWCKHLSEPVTEEHWRLSSAADKCRWRRMRVQVHGSLKPTRSASRPLWCEDQGISEHDWCMASKYEREQMRYRHHRSASSSQLVQEPDIQSLSLAEGNVDKCKVYVEEYTICPINVKALEHYIEHFAEGKRVWEAQGLIDAVKGSADSTIVIRYYRLYGVGRRLSDPWHCLATLHHHIRGVAALPMCGDPDKEIRDVDLKNAHCYLALKIGRDCGLSEEDLEPLVDYIDRRDSHFLPSMIVALGFRASDASSRDIPKKLWLAILNGGALQGWAWTHDVTYCLKSIPQSLKDHLKAFSHCCQLIRDAAIETHIEMKAKVGGPDSRVWHYIFADLEDKALQVVENKVKELGGQVHQLIYDGLLCSGSFCAVDLNERCQAGIIDAVGTSLELSVKSLKRPKGYDLVMHTFFPESLMGLGS